MNAKLIPAALLAVVTGFGACDGNDTTNPLPDTRTDATQPDGAGDSTPTDTTPDIVTQAGSVKAAQVEATAVTCDPQGFVDVNPAATLTNVVVTTPKFDASPDEDGSIDGYYVADQDGGAYSGIMIRIPAAMRPPALLVPGDVVDITGQLKEVFCWTQIEVATIVTKPPVTPPTPLVVPTPGDIANEAYESMLVRVNDVTIAKASDAGGKKFTPGDVEIGFAFDTGFIDITEGQTYDLVGVVRVNFNKFQLVPRGPGDVIPKSVTTSGITDIQGSAVSLACPDPNKQFVDGAKGIQLSGTILVGNHYITASLDGYILTDGTQNPYSAILLNISNSPKTDFKPGDVVSVTGDHQEFFCNSQIRASTITKTGGPAALPAPLVVAKGASAEDLEKVEGLLVEMSGVAATTYDAEKRQVGTDAGIGIDYGIMGPEAFDDGSKIAGKTVTIRGIMRFSRGNYRISPRSADDMVVP